MRNHAQLNMFNQKGINERFNADALGYFKFVPTMSAAFEDTCQVCALWLGVLKYSPWCERAHCRAEQRADGQNGYFKSVINTALASPSSSKNSPGSAGAADPDFGRCEKCYFCKDGFWCKFLKKPVLPNSDECNGNWVDINSVER